VDEVKKNNVKPSAVIVIGEVAELGRKLSWFEKTAR
jgi:siroheme synthase